MSATFTYIRSEKCGRIKNSQDVIKNYLQLKQPLKHITQRYNIQTGGMKF